MDTFKKIFLKRLRSDRITVFVHIAAILIIGLYVYGNSVKNGFLWDDLSLVKDNIHIKSWSHLPEIAVSQMGAGSLSFASGSGTFYRPLQAFTFMIDYSIWKLEPGGYHLTNIFLHIAAGFLLYWLIAVLFSDHSLSFFASLLFIVHPIQTEAVDYISGRADLLVFSFIALALILYIRYDRRENAIFLPLSLLSYTFALLSKENSLIFPAFILLYHCVFRRKIKVFPFMTFFAVIFLYFAGRVFLFHHTIEPWGDLSFFLRRVPGFFAALLNYARLLVFPFGLHMDYGQLLFRPGDPRVVAGFALLCALLIYAYRNRDREGLITFSVWWFLTALIPVSNIFHPLPFYMAEHYLYIPSVGFFAVISWFFCRAYRSEKNALWGKILILAVFFFLSQRTIGQNKVWADSETLYAQTLKNNPKSLFANVNLGTYYEEEGRYKEAIDCFNKAIECRPEDANLCANLASAYYRAGKPEEAIKSSEKAIKLDPLNGRAYNNLGAVYDFMGEFEKAEQLYKKALIISRDFSDPRVNLVNLYIKSGKTEKAIQLCNETLQKNPLSASSYISLGDSYYSLKETQAAIGYYERGLSINPDSAEVHYKLAMLYAEKKEKNKAMGHLIAAIEINPSFTEAYNDLAVLVMSTGRYAEAITICGAALQKEPDNPMLHNNIAIAFFYAGRYAESARHADKALESGYEVNPEFLKALEPYRKSRKRP